MADRKIIRRINELIRQQSAHPNPPPVVWEVEQALGGGAASPEIDRLLEAAKPEEMWGGTEITELLLARQIVGHVTGPGPVWRVWRAGWEIAGVNEAIDQARRQCLREGLYIPSVLFDIEQSAWEMYIAVEEPPSPGRALAVEIRNDCDFRRGERVLRCHELPEGFRPPKGVIVHTLDLPSVLGDIWEQIDGSPR